MGKHFTPNELSIQPISDRRDHLPVTTELEAMLRLKLLQLENWWRTYDRIPHKDRDQRNFTRKNGWTKVTTGPSTDCPTTEYSYGDLVAPISESLYDAAQLVVCSILLDMSPTDTKQLEERIEAHSGSIINAALYTDLSTNTHAKVQLTLSLRVVTSRTICVDQKLLSQQIIDRWEAQRYEHV
jgi:hypothetical protein